MKKFIKFAYAAMVGVAVLATTACTEEYSYDSIAKESGQEVFFPTTNASSKSLEMGEGNMTFEIPVSRVKTNEALTVNITSSVAQHPNLFSIPSSVSFAAGQAETTIPVTYNAAELGYEAPDTVKVAIADDAAVTPYGAKEYSVAVLIPAPLKLLGTGSFTDNFWFEEGNDVQIYQNTLNPNEFRVMDPFAMCAQYAACTGNQSEYVTLTLLQPGETLAGVNITKSDLVYFSSINTGYFHSSYSQEVWLHHPAAFSSLRNEGAWVYSKVVDYQENGLPGRIQLAPYYYMDGVGGWNKTSENNVVVIDFPGYTPKDYTLEMEYFGVLTDLAGMPNAAINLTLGEDVSDARAIVMSADVDDDAVADAIAAGDIEAVAVEAGTQYIPIAEGLTGKLKVIVVVLEEGVVKAMTSAYFEYYGGGANPWESLGIGLYTDDLVYPLYTEDGSSATYEVEIQENTDEPGLYRLVDPYGANFPYYPYAVSYTSSAIEVNATDADAVYILEQSTGLNLGDGEISILTEGGNYYAYYGPDYYDALKTNGYFGKLVNGVITFPSFNKKNDAGEVQYTYQGWASLAGTGDYRMGRNGELKIVLPSAVSAGARAKARAHAKARSFEKNLNSYNSYSKKERRIQTKRNAPVNREHMLTK